MVDVMCGMWLTWHVMCSRCGMVNVHGCESLNTRGGARRQLELEVEGGGGSTKKSCGTGSSHK